VKDDTKTIVESTKSKGASLRSLMDSATVALPGVFNAISAMLAERIGFAAVYVSGAGLSNAAGYPDEGLLSLWEVITQTKYIVDAVNVPVFLDADTGFGEVVNVIRAVGQLEDTGVSGLHIEDQELPKRCGHLEGKRLITKQAMEEKIRAAVTARSDRNFLIFARTDARSVEGFDAAVERGIAYARAGADGIFPEALESIEEFNKFSRRVRDTFGEEGPYMLANMTEFGKTPHISVEQFASAGYDMVIFPMTGFRVMMNALKRTYSVVREEGSQKRLMEDMMTRNELYELLRYDVYRKLDRQISLGGAV
jgi:methylisocitrate lyase